MTLADLRPATSESADPLTLHEPSLATTRLLQLVSHTLAQELAEERFPSGWADAGWRKRAADCFYSDLFEAAVKCEVDIDPRERE